MRNAKVWLFSGLLVAILAAPAVFLATSPIQAQPPGVVEHRPDQSYWRYHDNRWSHWDARDQRWYYTDGQHWFYHDHNRWNPYRFDRSFGREGFARGGYQFPGEPTTIVTPTHQVYVPR